MTDSLVFPDGFVEAVNGISAGGGDSDDVKGIIDGTIEEFTEGNARSLRDYAFYNCKSLTSVTFPNVTYIGNNAFKYCKSLITTNFPNAADIGNYGFQGCESLTSVNFPNVTSAPMYGFGQCSALTDASFSKLTNIATYAFVQCTNLNTLVLRNTGKVCTLTNVSALNGTPFASGGTGGIVLCPATLIPSYISATNWSTLYAAGTCLFWALEDYTMDGTITGEIFWLKLNADREGAFA